MRPNILRQSAVVLRCKGVRPFKVEFTYPIMGGCSPFKVAIPRNVLSTDSVRKFVCTFVVGQVKFRKAT